jgi:RimJ/RimL family protein N-acetyltransferase
MPPRTGHDVVVLLSDEAVVLLPLTPDDVEEWMSGEDAEQHYWFEFPGPAPRSKVERALVEWAASWRPDGPVRHWAIRDHEADRIVGGVELREQGDGHVDLSYVVFPAWRRRGIATRAGRLALAYADAVMKCRVAEIRVLLGNAGSVAVARKLGATVTGIEMTDGRTIWTVLHVDLAADR